MKARPVRLNGDRLERASRYLFIDKGRAKLTETCEVRASARHGFFVKDSLVLPGETDVLGVGEYTPVRALLDVLNPHETEALAIGTSLLNWDFITQKCGVCGGDLAFKNDELEKICLACKQNYFPQIQPVAIVLVRRGEELLLARGLLPRKHHSCLAGFVEVGETVEACAAREVKEEVGIDIENLRYFKSQYWPFPSNLMLGFVADYANGEIQIDKTEITHAAWFTRENPPESLPPTMSIARQMIDSVWS